MFTGRTWKEWKLYNNNTTICLLSLNFNLKSLKLTPKLSYKMPFTCPTIIRYWVKINSLRVLLLSTHFTFLHNLWNYNKYCKTPFPLNFGYNFLKYLATSTPFFFGKMFFTLIFWFFSGVQFSIVFLHKTTEYLRSHVT